ncbi:MAG TPA: ABC transporter permease [Vicinamibacterales bacterium]|nr:ABC transporter permease [Vicinamibacterales bacterium]
MTATFGSALVRKEVRGLLPVWGACMGALGLLPALDLTWPVVVVYAIGTITLGARAIGEEYAWHMLPVTLSLPGSRRRLFLTKLGVLAAMLAVVVALAWYVFATSTWVRDRALLPVLAFAPLYGLLVAPWMTMICRDTLAGAVFTLALPPLLFLGGQIIGTVVYGFGAAAEIDALTWFVLWLGTAATCGAGACLGWRRFLHLEALDGRGADVRPPVWLRRSGSAEALPPNPSRPIRALVMKELRLQHMTFVVVVLLVGSWAALMLLNRARPEVPALGGLTTTFVLLVSLLIGSLASAEERQSGTLEWQMLLPVSAWRQWIVKVIVVFGLVLVFFALALAIARMDASSGPFHITDRGLPGLVTSALLFAGMGLYASSLSRSGVGAMALSVVLAFALERIVPMMGAMWWTVLHAVAIPRWPAVAHVAFLYPSTTSPVIQALLGGLIVLLSWFAFSNHRFADRGLSRVGRQVASLVAYLVAALLVYDVYFIAFQPRLFR